MTRDLLVVLASIDAGGLVVVVVVELYLDWVEKKLRAKLKRRLAQLEAVEESKARVMLGRVHGQEWE